MEKIHSAELGSTLQELLDAPLEAAVSVLGSETGLPIVPVECGTARALLAHPSPPFELLDELFLAAQHHTKVPRAVADVIQLAAMAVAVTRCKFLVPPDEQMQFHHLYEIATQLSWVDEQTRELLDDGLAAMTPYDPETASIEAMNALAARAAAASAPKQSAARPTMQSVLSEMTRKLAAERAKAAKPETFAKPDERADDKAPRKLNIFVTLAVAIVAAAIVAVPLYFILQEDQDYGPKQLERIVQTTSATAGHH